MSEIKLTDYRDDVDRLITYIPWLEKKAGEKVSKIYEDNGIGTSSVSFPVYETMLLNFVNDAQKTGLMDQNYVYVYSHKGIQNSEDEKREIEVAELKDAEVLCGILSRYVLGGMTKGSLWTEAVENGVFLAILLRMKKLLAIWDAPLA